MFYTKKELKKIGFKSVGSNVSISNKTSIYNPQNITIGNNVRIDDFCFLSAGIGGIQIGNYIHISIYSNYMMNRPADSACTLTIRLGCQKQLVLGFLRQAR